MSGHSDGAGIAAELGPQEGWGAPGFGRSWLAKLNVWRVACRVALVALILIGIYLRSRRYWIDPLGLWVDEATWGDTAVPALAHAARVPTHWLHGVDQAHRLRLLGRTHPTSIELRRRRSELVHHCGPGQVPVQVTPGSGAVRRSGRLQPAAHRYGPRVQTVFGGILRAPRFGLAVRALASRPFARLARGVAGLLGARLPVRVQRRVSVARVVHATRPHVSARKGVSRAHRHGLHGSRRDRSDGHDLRRRLARHDGRQRRHRAVLGPQVRRLLFTERAASEQP